MATGLYVLSVFLISSAPGAEDSTIRVTSVRDKVEGLGRTTRGRSSVIVLQESRSYELQVWRYITPLAYLIDLCQANML